MRRKTFDKLQEWKDTSNGKSALLIRGARRVGKSTIAEEFAKHEYDSYILIDFNKAPKKIKDLFEDLDNLDEALKKLNKDWNGQRDKLYEQKLKEIEEAHNKWLAENNERNMIRQEEEAARNEEAVISMRLDADE